MWVCFNWGITDILKNKVSKWPDFNVLVVRIEVVIQVGTSNKRYLLIQTNL